MIFNEIYGCYYNAVAEMISLAIDGNLTEKKMMEVASQYAFEESLLTIVPAIKNQEWQLIDQNFETPIINKPTMPMTTLEKRWLKTILLDPRIALFQIPMGELKDVEPLFEPGDIVYFDRYLDGDRYDNPVYIANFYIIWQAIKEHRKVLVKFRNGRNEVKRHILNPIKIEYSDKEDKFRVLCTGKRDIRSINLGRIIHCKLLDEKFPEDQCLKERKRETLEFELTDDRNTLERVMKKFAHFEKQVEKIHEELYRVEMKYDVDDETDVLIQMMSFGRFVKILGPERLKEEICKRYKKQCSQLFFRVNS